MCTDADALLHRWLTALRAGRCSSSAWAQTRRRKQRTSTLRWWVQLLLQDQASQACCSQGHVLVQVPDVFILHLAAQRAATDAAAGRLRSRSLHTELVFNMSGSKHVRMVLVRLLNMLLSSISL